MPIEVTATDVPITVSASGTQIDATVSGGQGPAGSAGASATITVGTVTTGAAGSSASVTNVGTSSAAIFNFTIPAGATGATGPQGPAGTTTWAGITDKPSTFTPSAHTHTFTESSTTSTYTNFLTTVGGGTLADALSGIDTAISGKVGTSDSRLTDQRVPTDGSVTDAKITPGGLSASSINWTAIQPWAAGTAYQKGDLVSNAGIAYRRTAAGTSGATFNTDNWQQVTPSTTIPSDGSVTAAKIASAQTFSLSNLTVNGGVTVLPGGSGFLAQGATNPIRVLSALGGSLFVVNSSGQVTSGTWQGTAVAVANGGTGATTDSGARTNLGLGTAATAAATDFAAASHAHSAGDISFTATDRLLGRSSSGAGVGEEITCTAAGRALLDDVDAAAQRTTLGLGTAATSNTGDFATAGHTHTQLHDRSHAITSTSDHTAGNWKVFHSNGSGELVELALGAAATVLTSNGASAAPTFSALPAGGTKSFAKFTPSDNNPPASNYATLDTRNSVLVLEFDASTDESAVFVGYVPEGATLTSGLKVRISWMADTATSGSVRWGVQFEADGTDLDSDSFDTATLVTSAANGTSGIETVAEITATTIDSLAAGDRFRLKVYRDADDATNDTMTGDAQLVTVEVQVA